VRPHASSSHTPPHTPLHTHTSSSHTLPPLPHRYDSYPDEDPCGWKTVDEEKWAGEVRDEATDENLAHESLAGYEAW